MYRLLTVAIVFAISSSASLLQAQKPVKVPAKVQAEMAYLVGEWNYTAIENGKTFEGHYTARWAPGKQGLWMTFVSEIHNDFGVSAWDPETGEMVENWYGPTEGRLELRYRIDSAKKWSGAARNVRPDGTVSTGKMEVQKTDSNNFRFVKATEGQDMDITMRRKVVKADSNLAGLDAFVGDWVAESENGTRRTWSFSWDVTHRVLNNQMIQYEEDGEVAWTLNAILGWDQENEQLVNWGRGDTGQSADFYWTKLADGTWQVKAASGNRTWNFSHNDDLFHSTMTDGDKTSTIVFSRK
jgi:hypothetical protein